MKAHTRRAGAFSKYRHLGRISAKSLNVVLDPLQCFYLIQHCKIPRSRRVAGRQETKRTETILNHHNYHPVQSQNVARVCDSRTVGEASTVNVNHDW